MCSPRSSASRPTGLRIALLWENRAFGKSVGDGVRDYMKTKNLPLVYDEGYDQFATDMTPIVQKLKDVKPDVLIAISFPNDAILFQRKAKELDFNVAAFIGVSAGYSSPDLRNSIGNMVNGIFVSDFPPRVNQNVLEPKVRKVADEFYKRYEAKMKRPPAGHASAGFSAIWALFTEVFPKAKTYRAGRAARDRSQARSAGGQPGERQRHQVHQQRLAEGSEGCRPEPARLDRHLAVAGGRQQPGLSVHPRNAPARHGAVAGLGQALSQQARGSAQTDGFDSTSRHHRPRTGVTHARG